MPKQPFQKISVKESVKSEIDIIATVEKRHVYEVVEDMLKLYKSVTFSKSKSPSLKNIKPVSISDVVARQEG
jgi:hypothetical protein